MAFTRPRSSGASGLGQVTGGGNGNAELGGLVQQPSPFRTAMH